MFHLFTRLKVLLVAGWDVSLITADLNTAQQVMDPRCTGLTMLFFSLLLHRLETGLTVKLHAGASTHHVDYMQTETLWMLLKCKVAKKKKNLAGTAGFHWNKGMNE